MKKKKALMIVLAVLLLGLAGLMLSGCERDRELAAPTGLEITNDVLTWKAVEGADGYTVEINGEEYKTQNNALDLFEITNKYGAYEIRVAADSVTEGGVKLRLVGANKPESDHARLASGLSDGGRKGFRALRR